MEVPNSLPAFEQYDTIIADYYGVRDALGVVAMAGCGALSVGALGMGEVGDLVPVMADYSEFATWAGLFWLSLGGVGQVANRLAYSFRTNRWLHRDTVPEPTIS